MTPRRLSMLVEQERERFGAQAVGVAVVRGNEVVLCGGFGTATPETVFALSSNTKAFVGLALALAAQDGRLDLDAPVRELVPWFALADATAAVTTRDLLAHRTGLARHDLVWAGDTDLDPEALARSLPHLALAQPFRQGFLYNNTAYQAAAHVLEVTSGTTWKEAVARTVLEPLGMTATGFSIRGASAAATPFHRGVAQPLAHDGRLGASGAMVSTTRDLARWLTWLLRGSPAVEEAFTPAVPVHGVGVAAQDRVQVGYGLGWHVEVFRGHRVVRHGGSTPGWSSGVFLAPDAGLGVAVVTNEDSCCLAEALPLQLLELLLGLEPLPWGERYAAQYAGLDVALPESRTRRPGAVPWGEVAGTYTHPAYGTLELTPDQRVQFHGFDDHVVLRHRDRDVWELAFDVGLVVPLQVVTDLDGDVAGLRAAMDATVDPVLFARQPPVLEQDVLEQHAGTYVRDALSVAVSLVGGQLVAEVLGTTWTLVPVSETVFRVAERSDGRVSFADDTVVLPVLGAFVRSRTDR